MKADTDTRTYPAWYWRAAVALIDSKPHVCFQCGYVSKAPANGYALVRLVELKNDKPSHDPESLRMACVRCVPDVATANAPKRRRAPKTKQIGV